MTNIKLTLVWLGDNFQICLTFVMVFNFCLDQGAVKGLSGVHPR